MTPRWRVAAAAIAIAGAVSAMLAAEPDQQQTFRASTDVVLVDVSVRDGDRVVTGLGPPDFVLTDNGVRQNIESVDVTAVPIDLTLVVDVSAGRRPAQAPRVPLQKVIAQIERETREIVRLLRPDDRFRLFAIDRHVQEVRPFGPVSSLMPIAHVEFGGLSAVHDTLAAALLHPVEPARRHIVIAATKGVDSISTVGAGAIETIASRSDALFHVVLMEQAFDNDMALAGFQCAVIGACWPTSRFWMPFSRPMMGGRPVHPLLPDGQAIAAAAASTGGALHKTTVGGVPSLSGTFRKVFEDFRGGYMLRYTPQGVPRDGWHTIDVRVPASRSYTVRARKGYGVEVQPPAPASPPIPALPRTLTELTMAYDRGAYQPFVSGMRAVADPSRLIRDFQGAGNPWPAAPKREATFVLELAEAGVFSQRPATRREAYDLVERFARLIRHPFEPDVFERYWHFGALTLMEGVMRPNDAEAFVTRALARFPDEPRFVLSRAIIADQRWGKIGASTPPASPTGTPLGNPAGPPVDVVLDAYERAVRLPEVQGEARVRLAWLLHRIGRSDEALAQLAEAASAPNMDPATRYLRLLVLGHVLLARDRDAEAADAYRAALEVMPSAQSARVGLMNARLMQGERDAAEGLAESVQAERNTDVDPWWTYWQGQYRFYPAVMARLREMGR